MSKRGASERTVNVAVVGLSGTEAEKGALGVGKSCLCNRFVRPQAEQYYSDHISVMGQTDFGGRVVNNDHFLYWGDVTKVFEDLGELTFNVVEQTEFIDDSSFKPLRGTNTNNYIKRCVATKLVSAEKLMYICKDQLGIEHDYEQKQLPEGRLTVDGFLVVFDVSRVGGRSAEGQLRFLESILGHLHKRRVVLVATKCEEAHEPLLKEAERLAAARRLPLVETSAHENVNVDLAFATLAALLDRSRGRVKSVPFADAARQVRDQLDRATDHFGRLLGSEVTYYRETWPVARERLGGEPAYRHYLELLGASSALNLFRKHTGKLKERHLATKKAQYLLRFPEALEKLLPDLGAIRSRDWSGCQLTVAEHPDFDQWFLVLAEDLPWQQSDHLDSDDALIPWDLVTAGNDPEVVAIFNRHVAKLTMAQRILRFKSDFYKLLSKTVAVTPGKPYGEAVVYLMEEESYRGLGEEERKEIYNSYQKELREAAKEDFKELLYEKAELFAKYNADNYMSQADLDNIHFQLKDEPRYIALKLLPDDCKVIILKHMGFLTNPTRETCPSGEKCMDTQIIKCIATQAHRPNSWLNNREWSEQHSQLNVLLLAPDASGERLENLIKSLCEDENEYTLDGSIHNLKVRRVGGDIGQPQNAFKTPDFTPSVCFCAYSCHNSFNYIWSSLEQMVFSREGEGEGEGEEEALPPPFQGLPLAIIFTRGEANAPEETLDQLRSEGQRLADMLQCAFIDWAADDDDDGGHDPEADSDDPEAEPPESQVKQAFRAVLDTLKSRAQLGQLVADSDSPAPDIRIGMCMMCGDAYTPDMILGPVVNHQCCWSPAEGGEQTLVLETFLDETKRRVEVVATSLHRARTLAATHLRHGYILAYSASREASLAMVRSFANSVSHVPILILAITETGMFFSDKATQKLTTEGNKLADDLLAKFVTTPNNFQNQTAVYTPFFREALSKKEETEAHYKMKRSLSVEDLTPEEDGTGVGSVNNGGVGVEGTLPPDRSHAELPPSVAKKFSSSFSSSASYDSNAAAPQPLQSKPPYDSEEETTASQPLVKDVLPPDQLQRTPGSGGAAPPPPKPPRLVKTEAVVAQSPTSEESEGWVDNLLYDTTLPRESSPSGQQQPPQGGEQEGGGQWADNSIYETAAGAGLVPPGGGTGSARKKQGPAVKPKPKRGPPVAPKPQVPGKLNLAEFSNVTSTINRNAATGGSLVKPPPGSGGPRGSPSGAAAGSPGAGGSRRQAPLATPEDVAINADYASPKDTLLPSPTAEEGPYATVQDALHGSKYIHHVKGMATDSDSEYNSSLERPQPPQPQANHLYAQAALKKGAAGLEGGRKSKKARPAKQGDQPPIIPPYLSPQNAATSSDSERETPKGGEIALTGSKKKKKKSLRRTKTNQDFPSPGGDNHAYASIPMGVPVLPMEGGGLGGGGGEVQYEVVDRQPPPLPARHALQSPTDELDDEKKKGKLSKEEKDAEKQRRKEEKRQKDEEKKKQKEEERKEKEKEKERKKQEERGKKFSKRPKGGNSISYKYFGVSLDQLGKESDSADKVPVFVKKCVEYLELEGVEAEGLYRVPGKSIDSDKIMRVFDEDENMSISDMEVTVNAVATALKTFFSELPQPLIPGNVSKELLVALNIPEKGARLEKMKEVIRKLPVVHYEVFAYVMTHLHRIMEHSEKNLMNSENLSVCWWPTLLQPDFHSFEAAAQSLKLRDVVELFIVQSQFMFHNGEQV